MPKEAYNPARLVPTVKHGGGSVMIWAAISWHSAGPIITLIGRIAASDYADSLGSQVHPVVQMFPNNDAVFQDDSSPFTQPELFSLGLSSRKMHCNTFTGQHSRQTFSNYCGQL
jgi:hypothetical protein